MRNYLTLKINKNRNIINEKYGIDSQNITRPLHRVTVNIINNNRPGRREQLADLHMQQHLGVGHRNLFVFRP